MDQQQQQHSTVASLFHNQNSLSNLARAAPFVPTGVFMVDGLPQSSGNTPNNSFPSFSPHYSGGGGVGSANNSATNFHASMARSGSSPPSLVHIQQQQQQQQQQTQQQQPRYKFKTELCRNWEMTGQCAYRQCTFAHGAEELRQQSQLAAAAAANSTPPGATGSNSTPSISRQDTPVFSQQQRLHFTTPGFDLETASYQQQHQLQQQSHGMPMMVMQPGASSVQVVAALDAHVKEFLVEVARDKEAFLQLVEKNRLLEKELQALQSDHIKEKHALASLREKAAGLRVQLEVVPRPSFMVGVGANASNN